MASISFPGTNYGIQAGDNHGSIVAEIHLPAVRPETPPGPLSTIPFPRDPDFVHRDTLLHQIYEKNSVPGSRIALIGLGGVGKSQLAIEYAYQVRTTSPATWVFWIHASNEARFEESFREIADRVKIPGRQIPKANIFKLVEDWLRDEKIGKWICILDNADDEFICSLQIGRNPTKGPTNTPTKPLLEYVPRSPNGSTIITSRTREVALKMVDHRDLIEVKPMERPEALELLQRKLDTPADSQESEAHQNELLVDALEFMPLAIVQAASLVRNRAPRYSVSQYLTDFQKSDRGAIKLLEKEVGHLPRDWEAKNSILVTWQMSFDYICQTKPSAAELLSYMSFFDRQGIPESLIRNQSQGKYTSKSEPLDEHSSDGETSESDSSPDFEDDVTTLRDYSFISVTENNSFFTMHRLVQLTTRAWLKSHGQLDQWRDQFISTLCEEFPTGEYENWERCTALFPHVKSAMSQRPTSTESLQKWATLLYKGAWHAWQSDNITDTRKMASKSRKERMMLFGDDHDGVFASSIMLAIAFGLEGRWEETEHLQMQGMENRKTRLGADHPDTLSNMSNLAWTYRSQGRWDEAEQLTVYVMNTRRTKLGADHHLTLGSTSSLASTYLEQGRWKEAEQLFLQLIELRKTKLGTDHPDTLSDMSNLASTYRSQGRWKEAEQLEIHLMETSKMTFSADHAVTLTSISNLASTYWNQGRWEHAERLFIQVMETRKTKLGTDHPDTLMSMGNLASTYYKQGRLDQAEQLFALVMETTKAKLGPDHPDTLTSMANLASTFRGQNRWDQAEQLELQVVDISKRKLGAEHPDTLASIANLALTYWNQGRWEQAEDLHAQVMETRKTNFGADHPDTLTSMAHLAVAWKSLGRSVEVIDLLGNCLVKQKQILGLDHPQTIFSSQTLLDWETNVLSIK